MDATVLCQNTGVDPINVAAHILLGLQEINARELSKCTERYTEELLGKDMVFSVAKLSSFGGQTSKSAGSEDFAYISHKVPTIMIALSAGQAENGYSYPQHHPKVKFDEDALFYGSSVYAYVAMKWLMENTLN